MEYSLSLHNAAINGETASVAELLLRGADGAVQDCNGYRCAAQPKPKAATAAARRHTPKRWAEAFRTLADYEAAERQVHSPRRPTAPPLPPTLPVPTDAPSVLAVGIRRSSGQGGDAALAL